jgi:hypothetical protein
MKSVTTLMASHSSIMPRAKTASNHELCHHIDDVTLLHHASSENGFQRRRDDNLHLRQLAHVKEWTIPCRCVRPSYQNEGERQQEMGVVIPLRDYVVRVVCGGGGGIC